MVNGADAVCCHLYIVYMIYCWLYINCFCIVGRVKETNNGTQPKSAPCTPCANHDITFDVDNFDHSVVRQNPTSYASSTPRLNQSVHGTSHAHQHSLDRHRHRPAAVGYSPTELISHLRQSHTDDVNFVRENSRRHRRHRTRERHRSANRYQ